MRYMTFVKSNWAEQGQPPQGLMDAMDEWIKESAAQGTFIAGGGLGSADQVIELRLKDGEVTRTDGPYAEAKEIVGGYAILECRDDAEAAELCRRTLELHKQHWPGWEGACEARPIFE